MQNKEYVEDKIDLKELFQTILNRKKFIIVFTFLVTLTSIIYVSSKNPIPIYQGKVFVEIGEIQSQKFGLRLLDNPRDLSAILNLKFDVEALVPKRTTLLEIRSTNSNKEIIKNNLQKSIDFIFNRHKEKAKFYENTIMTKQIGDIVINNTPINVPKKKLIVTVSFVTAFILSIFIIFFMQFILTLKEEK